MSGTCTAPSISTVFRPSRRLPLISPPFASMMPSGIATSIAMKGQSRIMVTQEKPNRRVTAMKRSAVSSSMIG